MKKQLCSGILQPGLSLFNSVVRWLASHESLSCGMKILKFLIIWNLILLSGTYLFAQKSWVLKKDKDGIKVSSRETNRSKFNDIKVEMDLPGNISQLADILIDVDKYSQWSYSVRKTSVVKRISPFSLVYYMEIDAPWPVTDRDLYALFEMQLDSLAKTMKISALGSANFRPLNKDMVRIPYSKGSWDIRTVNDKTIHLIYTLEIDPGGSVPAWIMNLFAVKAPLVTFQNLKQKMILLNRH